MAFSPKIKSAAFAAIALASVAALTAGCHTSTSGSTGGGGSSSTITVGEYGSMTGPNASFGVSTDKGIQMAIDEINAAGGVNGVKLALKSYDDQSLPDQAKTVVTKLIENDDVTAVLGEVASSNSLAAAPECQKSKVPMISPASTNAKVTQVGDYIFRTCYIDPFQGGVMAVFATKTLKAKTAAVFTNTSSDYSKGLADAYKAAFIKLGGKIVSDQSYTNDTKDYHTQIASIKASNPDVIFIPGYYDQVPAIAQTARTEGLTCKIIGGDGWDSPDLIPNAKGALEGCYFSTHYSPDSTDPIVKAFVAAYAAKNGGVKPDAMAALGYDTMHILANAITAAGKPADGDYTSDAYRAKLCAAIAATKNYGGVTGLITIGPDRNAIKPATVLEISGAGYQFAQSVSPSDVPA